MCIKKYYITLILLLLGAGAVHSQEKGIHKRWQDAEVHFRFDNSNLEPDYMDNRASLQELARMVDSIGVSKIDSIVIVSQSSPEGVYEYNLLLARKRAKTLHKYIKDNHPDLSDRLYMYSDGESWSQLREYVMQDTLMKQSTIDKIISIIDADINVGTKKWRMEQLPVYRYLLRTYYPRLRNSVFCLVYYSERTAVTLPACRIIECRAVKTTPDFMIPLKRTEEKAAEPSEATELTDTTDQSEAKEPTEKTDQIEPKEWCRQFHVKTNAIGWGMAISNIAPEVDIARHWSFTMPVLYSAWNYFKTTIKLRAFAIQPEFRYWLSQYNNGLFAGAHFSLAHYNLATGGAYRYQDHSRETPALGGGLSVGYRLPFSRNGRWRVEFSVGAGVYANHYDVFYNTPDTKDGLLVKSVKKTYWGIDQASVSFSYSFDLKKKGGRR